MSDYVFKFKRVDTFLDDINRDGKFDSADMDGITKNYKMVLVSECPNDINECIDEDGTINTNECSIIETDGEDDGLLALSWIQGINGERTMSIANSTVSYDLGENESELKAVFLINIVEGSGYVIAYAINSYSITVGGEVILPCDGMIWSIKYGG